MEKKYFKHHCESGSHEWTMYGCYEEKDVTDYGDFLCTVDDVDSDPDNEHIHHTIYKILCDLDKVTHITEEEYNAVIKKLNEVESLYNKADEIMKQLL